MGYEVISFKAFLSGSPLVSGGLTILSVVAMLLVLIILERLGFAINERLVRIVGYTAIGYSLLLLVWKFVLFLANSLSLTSRKTFPAKYRADF